MPIDQGLRPRGPGRLTYTGHSLGRVTKKYRVRRSKELLNDQSDLIGVKRVIRVQQSDQFSPSDPDSCVQRSSLPAVLQSNWSHPAPEAVYNGVGIVCRTVV